MTSHEKTRRRLTTLANQLQSAPTGSPQAHSERRLLAAKVGLAVSSAKHTAGGARSGNCIR